MQVWRHNLRQETDWYLHGTPTVETYHPRDKHFNLHEYLQDGDIKRWTMWPKKSQQRLTIVIGLNKLCYMVETN
jgi:hypothetical protein